MEFGGLYVKLTKSTVAALPLPETGQAFYFDDELASFGVRVTAAGSKSYILDRRIKGKRKRITLGTAAQIAPDEARKLARRAIGEILAGGDPVEKKRREKLQGVTLEAALEGYIESRGAKLKPRTIADMRTVLKRQLATWMKRPFTSITEEQVAKKHRELGATSQAQADLAMRYLRAVIELAGAEFRDSAGNPLVTMNPVSVLSRRKLWFRVDRRKTVIGKEDLPAWFAAVQGLPPNVRDYFVFLLLTGARSGEAATLKWETVNLRARTLTLMDTKNHRPHTLPMGEHLHVMLLRRKKEATGEFVFTARHGDRHLRSSDSAIRLVEKNSGVGFCKHDLRRGFATAADSLDISGYTVKRLLNHIDASDVTQAYVAAEMERLRKAMQKIEDHLLAACGVRETAEIVPIRAAHASS